MKGLRDAIYAYYIQGTCSMYKGIFEISVCVLSKSDG